MRVLQHSTMVQLKKFNRGAVNAHLHVLQSSVTFELGVGPAQNHLQASTCRQCNVMYICIYPTMTYQDIM